MPLDRNQIAKRAAQELKDGFYVNLGIGMPTLVANYVRRGSCRSCLRLRRTNVLQLQ